MEKFAPILHLTGIQELDLSLNPLGNNGVKIFSEYLWVPVDETNNRFASSYKKRVKCELLKLNISECKF